MRLLETECGRPDFAGDCRLAPLPDVRWSHRRETGLPQDLPNDDAQTANSGGFIRVTWPATASVDRDGSLPTLCGHRELPRADLKRVPLRDADVGHELQASRRGRGLSWFPLKGEVGRHFLITGDDFGSACAAAMIAAA